MTVIRTLMWENVSSGFLTKWDSNQSPQLQKLARKLTNILLVSGINMILSNKWMTKALIRLSRCAGWYALLLFANPEVRFSPIQGHNMQFKKDIKSWSARAKLPRQLAGKENKQNSPWSACSIRSSQIRDYLFTFFIKLQCSHFITHLVITWFWI